jgi:putative NADH-flavin reductase
MRIALYGAPGRIGSRIAAEAVSRDHVVTGLSRSPDPVIPEGVTARQGDASDADDVARIAAEHDVVVSAIAPSRSGGRPQVFLNTVSVLAENVGTRRFVMVGGSGSLQVSPGLRLMDVGGLPPEARREAETQAEALELLRDTGALVDWLYISPANRIGPGERTGVYRIGHETPIGDWVSAEDFAVAVVDELETPRYHRAHINIAT